MQSHTRPKQLSAGNALHALGTAFLAGAQTHQGFCVGCPHWHSSHASSSRLKGTRMSRIFLFPHLDMQSLTVSFLAPASYARALLCLRWAAQDPGLSQQAKLSSAEARALTLHSMKSTALALAAQLHLPREDRLSQGHHRDSAKLCSRNDTFASLRVQRHICAQVAQGWRPQRSMSRGGAAPVPEPPFTVPRQVPSTELPAPALLQGPWRIFTSRHETLHAAASTARQKPGADPPEVEPPLVVSGSDSEAEEVELFAQTAPDSDSEAQTKNNSCSVMTRACTHTFAVAPGVACMSRHPPPCRNTCLRCPSWDRFRSAS